ENRLDVWCVAREAMKVDQGDAASRAVKAEELHTCIERRHRHCHVGGMHRDAGIARTEYGVGAVEAADRRAPRPWLALVAPVGRHVVEVRTAGALKEVAAH